MYICFDMDGTLANFYGVADWLECLEAEDETPYRVALPLLNLSLLARYIHKVQDMGIKVAIISWSSKSGSENFHERIEQAKLHWLKQHLPSVAFDAIHIVPYGTPKHEIEQGILFDDEKRNREAWGEGAYDADEILAVLKNIIKGV